MSRVGIKRLSPTVTKLGYLRLWADDLQDIVGIVEKLGDVSVMLEADHTLLTDVEADLPKIGSRLDYFTIRAARNLDTIANTTTVAVSLPGSIGRIVMPKDSEILRVHLAKNGCRVEAIEPDFQTSAVMGMIEKKVREFRRVPLWVHPIYWVQPPEDPASGLATILLALSISGIVIGAISLNLSSGLIPWPGSLILTTIAGLVAIGALIGGIRARSVLITATRAMAPTWWERNRDGFIVGMVTGLVTGLLAGVILYLLTPHP